MKLGLLKPPQTSPRSIGLTEHTLDMDLLPKAALWESSHTITLLWDHQTQWRYYVFLPRCGPGNTRIGSGSESSLPFKHHHRHSPLELLLPFSFQQLFSPSLVYLYPVGVGGGVLGVADRFKLLKYLNPRLLRLNAQTLLSLFSNSLLTLLPSMRDNARLWSQPN